MGRQSCCEKLGLKRGPWTMEEDKKLMNFILNNGIQCWRLVPKHAGLMRCGKSCRLRWINYLRPDLKRGAFTEQEEDMMIELHSRLGNRWSKIATHFAGRTDNEIKNHWNTRIKKKMKLMGLDPLTHKPIEQNTQNSAQEESDEIYPKIGFYETCSSDPRMYPKPEKQEGALISGLNQDKTINMGYSSIMSQNVLNQNKIESCIKNMDMGSSIMYQNEPLRNFSLDPFENWMDNPFFWDGFNNLERSFP